MAGDDEETFADRLAAVRTRLPDTDAAGELWTIRKALTGHTRDALLASTDAANQLTPEDIFRAIDAQLAVLGILTELLAKLRALGDEKAGGPW